MALVGRMLASLPGGEEFEDVGYEPYPTMGWKEFEFISNVFSAVDDKWDVEQAAEILLHEDDEEDED
jgi:hypothetical protein